MAARSTAAYLVRIAGSNSPSLVECCVLSEFSASGLSLVQRCPSVSECDRETSGMRRMGHKGLLCRLGERMAEV